MRRIGGQKTWSFRDDSELSTDTALFYEPSVNFLVKHRRFLYVPWNLFAHKSFKSQYTFDVMLRRVCTVEYIVFR